MTAHQRAKEWLSSNEIADLQLPGLPTTGGKVRDVASREGWKDKKSLTRPRPGTAGGGGLEYHVSLLPPQARLAYLARFITVSGAVEDLPVAHDDRAGAITERAAHARDARIVLLREADSLGRAAGLTATAADRHFCELYNAGTISAPEWVRTEVKHLAIRTLARWRKLLAKTGSAALAIDKAKNRKGKGVLSSANGGRVQQFVLGCLVKQPHLSAKRLRDLILSEFGAELEIVSACGEVSRQTVPPIRTIQHFVATLKDDHKVELTAITNPDAFKSRYRVSGRNSYRHIRSLNQLWMIDSSPADALCLDGRWSVYVAIEVYSRCVMLYVSRTPRAEAVNLLLRRALLKWGVPDAIKTDNGSDFVADRVKRLLAGLDIEAITSRPFTPEEKAFVERAIGTMQRDLMPLLPGFIGHSVADRKTIEARRSFAERIGSDDKDTFAVELTGADLQRHCDGWAEQLYAFEPHAAHGGKAPAAVMASARATIRQIDARALDMLLMPLARGGLRVVQKDGVRVDGLRYLCPAIMPETEVLVRMDPADLGRIYLYSPDSELFLGEAICPNAAGLDPRAVVAEARQIQKAIIDERMAAAKAEAKRLTKGPALIDRVMRANAERAGKLATFPKPTVEHTTPALIAAAHAARPPSVETTPLTPREAEKQAEILARMASGQPATTRSTNVVHLPEPNNERTRFKRSLDLSKRLAGGDVSPEEARWLHSYHTSAEYRALLKMHSAFGDDWLHGDS